MFGVVQVLRTTPQITQTDTLTYRDIKRVIQLTHPPRQPLTQPSVSSQNRNKLMIPHISQHPRQQLEPH